MDSNSSTKASLAWVASVLEKNAVSIAKPEDFEVLMNYDIALILDDSGSMRSRAGDSGLLFGQSTTRWDELQQTAQQVIDVATAFTPEGIDVRFLNQGKVAAVQSGDDPRLAAKFAVRPSGSTPLTETVQAVLQEHRGKKPLLVVVCTDGLPNGGVAPLARVIEDSIWRSRGSIRFQLMACTDNDDDIAWMNTLDYKYSEVDTTDDYHTERREVLRRGVYRRFERGDWIAKALLGAVSKKFDCADDMSVDSSDREGSGTSSLALGGEKFGGLLGFLQAALASCGRM
eukprot:TRINITY_DN96141_c0_g1_i1.p1 TRINITY_DN96141_c0_g1~~TRINITY_DN96141_c0_g1_i1.p1  ORF type:complete len:286 (+),score=64.67 TRINITY_DN96141_c0_g1_i1:87-944(+)